MKSHGRLPISWKYEIVNDFFIFPCYIFVNKKKIHLLFTFIYHNTIYLKRCVFHNVVNKSLQVYLPAWLLTFLGGVKAPFVLVAGTFPIPRTA